MILRDFPFLVSKKRIREEKAKEAQKLAVGMSVVAAAGVATGILLAPKSGKDTRDDLGKLAVSGIESITDTVQKKAGTMKYLDRLSRKHINP